MPTRPRHLSSITAWDIDTDVAVIGFGGAGACAAIEAHDNGARVVLFDLASDSGGSTRLSSAEIYMGGGTRVQKACGIEDSAEDMFRFLMASNGPIADEAKVRAYCEGSVDHFDWLTQTLGVPYKDSVYPHRAIMALTDDCLLYTGSEKAWPFTQIATPAPRGHNLQVEGDNGGPLFANILRRNVEERGIEVHFDARALTLVTDDDGTVHGVVVRIDQQERLVRALSPHVGARLALPDGSFLGVLEAHLEEGRLVPDRVLPPGGRAMGWDEYLRGHEDPLAGS
jgi:succinate dehydrogenase/fumarate reductase flavoprotein subunit